MATQRFAWHRFRSDPSASVALTTAGYLLDPEGTSLLGAPPNPAAVPFETLDARPGLVLLGEPGIGKSAEMGPLAAQPPAGDAVLFFHLRDYQTDLLLRDDIFGHPDFQTWARGEGELTLFLDGLDEGLLSIKQLATLLPAQLRRFPIARLRLRLACRTAE